MQLAGYLQSLYLPGLTQLSVSTTIQCELSAEKSCRCGLPTTQVTTAVKVLKKLGCSSFETELRTMYPLKHANLVRLLAFCKHDAGQPFRALVYEYMANKSLKVYILGNSFIRMRILNTYISLCLIIRNIRYIKNQSKVKFLVFSILSLLLLF